MHIASTQVQVAEIVIMALLDTDTEIINIFSYFPHEEELVICLKWGQICCQRELDTDCYN